MSAWFFKNKTPKNYQQETTNTDIDMSIKSITDLTPEQQAIIEEETKKGVAPLDIARMIGIAVKWVYYYRRYRMDYSTEENQIEELTAQIKKEELTEKLADIKHANKMSAQRRELELEEKKIDIEIKRRQLQEQQEPEEEEQEEPDELSEILKGILLGFLQKKSEDAQGAPQAQGQITGAPNSTSPGAPHNRTETPLKSTLKLTDKELREQLEPLKSYKKVAKKMSDEQLKTIAKKNTDFDDETIERALVIVREEW